MELLEVITDGRIRTVGLAGARVTIGRGPSNDIDLTGDTGASREHALLTHDTTSWKIVDRGSTNGTYVNGQRVTEPVSVEIGDQIEIGTSKLVVTVDNSTTALHRFDDFEAMLNHGGGRISVADRRVLNLIAKGATDNEIALALSKTPLEVTLAIEDLKVRMDCKRRVDLARLAIRMGLS
jgi:pSer/pThr/pTyr-binding forkhead associated (FHA) protein